MRVLNQMGAQAASAITAAFPNVEVVDASGEIPDDRSADILFGAWTPTPGFFELAERSGVRWVHIAATGVEEWPAELYEGRLVTCSRGASAVPISEFVLGAMLAFEKHIPDIWVNQPPDTWGWAKLGGLDGKTLGLVGLGGIGGAIARRALAFDMEVVALRRTEAPSGIAGVRVETDLAAVTEMADHLVLAAPLTARTRGILGADAFSGVKRGVHLVNIARGALIDQDALKVALNDGTVAMATLDVCDPEPPPPGHWLYAHPGVRLSPHISWSSPQLLDRILAAFLENLGRYLAGEHLVGVVDGAQGY